MNENYKEMKGRIRRLDELLVAQGMENPEFARAVDMLRRAAKHGDRRRDPSSELRALLEKAEELGRMLAR